LDFKLAAIVRLDFFLPTRVLTLGAARFDFLLGAVRLRRVLDASSFDTASALASVRLAKYSFIGSK
jgi:hypothetical protein